MKACALTLVMPEAPSKAKLSAGPRSISVWAKAPIPNDDRTSKSKVSNFIRFSVLHEFLSFGRHKLYRVQCSRSVQLCTCYPYARAARSSHKRRHIRCTTCCYQAIALTENCYRQRDCKKSGRELEEKRRAALCQRYHRRIFTETLPCSAEFSHHVARAQNGQIPCSSQSGCRLLKPRFRIDGSRAVIASSSDWLAFQVSTLPAARAALPLPGPSRRKLASASATCTQTVLTISRLSHASPRALR